MIPNSNFGANINVTKNVIIDITASCFWTRQAYFIGLNLIRLITAVIMTAAKVACGIWYKSGVKNNSVIPKINIHELINEMVYEEMNILNND